MAMGMKVANMLLRDAVKFSTYLQTFRRNVLPPFRSPTASSIPEDSNGTYRRQ